MTDDQHERVVQLKDRIERKLKNLVDRYLANESTDVEELVRTLLTEQMRFWKEPK